MELPRAALDARGIRLMVAPPDPCAAGGLEAFGARLRAGELTAESATRDYLRRIAALDPELGAYQHVAADRALAAARRIDRLLAAGVDLGPLMGVPIAVKDLLVVDGMPTTAGSLVDVSDVTGTVEGGVVGALVRAGCVVLGKARTVEFGLGATGVSAPRGTPRNPADAHTVRIPGGSSSGPAVAVAAGLCAFAVGGDTGGSVRIPAALCGVVGFKTTVGRWPTDGAFPLAGHLDTVGLLTRSARDAAVVLARLSPAAVRPGPTGLRLGVLDGYVTEGLSPEIARGFGLAVDTLSRAGVPVAGGGALPGAAEREEYFPQVLPAALIETLGPERFLRDRHLMDPVVAERAAAGLEVRPRERARLERRRRSTAARVHADWADGTVLLSPTTAAAAPALADLADPTAARALAFSITRATQPVNYLGLCAVSLPLPVAGLPVGLQLVGPPGADAELLAAACAVERIVGAPPRAAPAVA